MVRKEVKMLKPKYVTLLVAGKKKIFRVERCRNFTFHLLPSLIILVDKYRHSNSRSGFIRYILKEYFKREEAEEHQQYKEVTKNDKDKNIDLIS